MLSTRTLQSHFIRSHPLLLILSWLPHFCFPDLYFSVDQVCFRLGWLVSCQLFSNTPAQASVRQLARFSAGILLASEQGDNVQLFFTCYGLSFFFKQLWYNNACFQKMCSGCVAWELDKAESSCFICSGRMCLRFIPFRFTNSLARATPIKNVRFFTGFAAFECLQVYANVPACSHWWFRWSWIESVMPNLHTGVCLWVAFSRLSAKCEFL